MTINDDFYKILELQQKIKFGKDFEKENYFFYEYKIDHVDGVQKVFINDDLLSINHYKSMLDVLKEDEFDTQKINDVEEIIRLLSEIKEFPKNIVFDCNVNIENSKIKKFNNVEIRGNFVMNNSELETLEGLKAKNIKLKETKLKEVPDNFEAISLIIESNPIEKVGKNIKVDYGIQFINCNDIKEINTKDIPYVFDNLAIDIKQNYMYKIDKNYSMSDFFKKEKIYENITEPNLIHNTLVLLSENSLGNKLLSENFQDITHDEINNYIDKKHKFGIGNVIDYCRSTDALYFVAQNGYNFNVDDLNKIKDNNLKSNYQNIMLKQQNTFNTQTPENDRKRFSF